MGDSQSESRQDSSVPGMPVFGSILGINHNMHDLPLLVRDKSIEELNQMWESLQTKEVVPYQFNRSHLLAYIYIARKRREKLQNQASIPAPTGN